MSPGQLLEQLEGLGSIDPKILKKIRQEIENPAKNVKPKAVLSYLVKKNQITQEVAARLMKTPATPPAKPKGKIPVVQPIVPHDATILDEGQFGDLDNDVVEIDAAEVYSPDPYPAPVAAGYDDYDDGMASEQFEAPAPRPASPSTINFVGKKDKSDQWSTKWLYIGFGILGALMIVGAVLYIATMGVKAEDQYTAAKQSMDKFAFLDAAKKFEEYFTDNPSHEFVPLAKIYRVQCLIRNAYTSKNWSEAITTADTHLPPLLEEEDSKIDEIRDDLAVVLPDALLNITEKSKKATTLAELETELSKCLELKKVIDNNVYIPTSQRKKPFIAANLAKIENNIDIIEGAINKEKDYNAAIAEVKQLSDASETDKAFAVYKKLTRNHPDLAAREELRNTMLAVSAKEQQLVLPVPDKLISANLPRPTPIQNSVVLATRSGERVDSLLDEVVHFLADGSVYGLQVGNGKILWRRFVGYQTTIQPESMSDETLLVSDQQSNDVLLLNKDTGEIVWRTEIDEPFVAPAFNAAMIVVSTRSGKVIKLNRDTGESLGSVQLPQALSVPALVADRDPFIYQPGNYSNLYVLSNDDLSCREVHYIGHYSGSIAVPPVAWQGFILISTNTGDASDLLVLKPATNGLDLQVVQVMKRITTAPITTPIQRFTRWQLLSAENGDVRILELLPTEDVNPVTLFAADHFDNSDDVPAFTLTEGSNLWIAGLGVSSFRIQRADGTFKRNGIFNHTDTFLTPLQKIDDYILHVRRRYDSGMLSATLARADKNLTPVWRTDFGGQVVGEPQLTDDSLVAVSNQGDTFKIPLNEMLNGSAEVTSRGSEVIETLKFESLISMPNDMFAVFGPPSQEDYLVAKASTGQSKLTGLEPPANHPACRPMPMGDYLIVPSSDGQVARIDPKTGRLVGSPFQPAITPNTVTEWFEPALIADGLFAIASGNGAADNQESKLFLLNAAESGSVKEVDSLVTEEPFKSRLVHAGGFIFGVIDGGGNDYLAQIKIEPKLELVNKSGLPGHVVEGPWLLDNGLLLKMDNDQLMFLGGDLNPQWTLDIPNQQFASPPVINGSGLMLTFRSGKILLLDPASGQIGRQFDLRQPISSGPVSSGGSQFFSGRDGTVHEVNFSASPGGN